MGKRQGTPGFENKLSIVLITSLYLMLERIFAADKYMCKVNSKKSRTNYGILQKLAIKTNAGHGQEALL